MSKLSIIPLATFASMFLPTLHAGQLEVKAPVETIIEPAASESPWEFTFRSYGWIAGLNGTTGIGGYTAEADVKFKDILENLQMAAMLQVDVRYDRWLLLLDGQYMRLGADTQPEDGILSSASVEITQIMLEAVVGYRVLQSDAGYLDVFAGARYMSVDGEINLEVDSGGVRDASENLSREIFDSVTDAVQDAATPALNAAKTAAQEKLFEFRGNAREKLEDAVKDRIRDRLDEIIGGPAVGRDIVRRGPVGDAIRDLIQAQGEAAQAEIDAAKENLTAEVQAAKASARARARHAVTKAEHRLAKELESAINDAIPERVAGKKEWVDPIIGFRGRWNFSGPCYLAGRADIGGFGVGSDLAWQAYGALGVQVSRSSTIELGYRYLAVDYTSGGFTYDVATSGAVIAFGVQF